MFITPPRISPQLLLLLIYSSMTLTVEAYTVEVLSKRQMLKLTWEKSVEERIRQACEAKQATIDADRPLMVSLVGIPGSGKSTSAEIVSEDLGDIGCLLMPFDGYHLPRTLLSQAPNAADKLYRRGAPDTFDPSSLVRDLQRIRHGLEPMVGVPGFDHARGDPDQNAHVFHRNQHKIVVCEGLYLLHDQHGWEEIADCFDLSIFVDADVDVCMDRLKVRNLCIPGYSPEEILLRVDAVDRVNAMTVLRSKHRADVIVQSAV
jgi:pantothenate kinase